MFTGKFSLKHVPIIEDLILRKVLQKPPLQPFFMEEPAVQERLKKLRAGMTVLGLLKKEAS